MERNHDEQIAYSFFKLHPLMTLTTLSKDGVPQNAMVYVYMDENMNCFCATRDTTRKYSNITANSTVVLSVYDENVLMFGELTCEAELLVDEQEVAEVLPELQKIVFSRKSLYWIPPVAQVDGHNYVFFKIKPKKVNFVNYEQSSSENPKPHTVSFDVV